ncbi:glycosyltransferase family 9 protein [Gluconacetobacter aggeris]|uniref:Glycosyltransferase family 9 protein n=1 Tax=Gluconacetobacter aggeris TaxID=1286186 RepID=A0A7W4NXI1_9PROT|nr:glycosyltransferase family 9 protein [Gluconacetobacter aggeris]MBB2169634.1 glycosyltransferase family 9 protein [Gluconacetobacter aggeris]
MMANETVGRAPIVIAPFANERAREWPLENFHEFIRCGLKDGYDFVVSGMRGQRPLANVLVRSFPADRVRNACGATTWREMQTLLRQAPFVVANNSGIGHLAADLGQWVLCVFSGSHSWVEWMPRGPKVVTLARMPACAPCERERCPNDRDCMINLRGSFAYAEMTAIIRDYSKKTRGQGTVHQAVQVMTANISPGVTQ